MPAHQAAVARMRAGRPPVLCGSMAEMAHETVLPRKDPATITPDGKLLKPMIDGVVVRYQQPVEDRRGEVLEVYRPSWGVHEDPLVYVYQIRLRPGAIKGWVIHEHQDDRLFFVTGVLRWGLYDDRPGSPTRGLVNDLVFSERAAALLVIPRGVYHAVRNIGTTDAIFINMPTRAYEHGAPDKLRLPLKTPLIPFDFDDGPGW
jgi:dTDP-4-dehydrorhamnose 3,5-epimerase